MKCYSFSFPVDKATLEQHFLEGKTFDDCYKEDRLFYISYKDLEEYIAKASNAVSFITQKQPIKGLLIKRCSENMQQIYRRTLMSKCDFNKVELY